MLNKRNIWLLIISGILLIITFNLIQKKTQQEHIIDAKTAIVNKQWSEAIISLKNALIMVTDKSEVSGNEIKLLLAKVYLSYGDMGQTIRFLGPLVTQKYNLIDTIPAYAKALFHQNSFQELSILINNNSVDIPKISSELKLYKVLLLHKTGSINEAHSLFLELSDTNKSSVLGLFTHAFILAKEEPEYALELVDKLLKLDTEYPDAYLLKGQLHFSQQSFDDAYTSFEHYLTLQPNASHVHFLLAISALQTKNDSRMQKHVSILLSRSPDHPLANHLQALLSFNKKEFHLAKISAAKSLQSGLISGTNYLIAGISALNLKQDEQAYEYLLKAVHGLNNHPQVVKLLTLVQLKLGYLQAAIKNYEKISIASDLDVSLGNMLATQLLSDQNNTGARKILEKLQFAPVSNPMLKIQHGILELKAGNKEGLAIMAQLATEIPKNEITAITHIMALADTGDIEQALEQAIIWQKTAPSNVNAMNIIALLNQKTTNTSEAKKWYRLALEIEPNNIPSLLFQSYDAISRKEITEARNAFKKVLSIAPNHILAFKGLLQLTLQTTSTPNWTAIQSLIMFDKPHDNVLMLLANAMLQSGASESLDYFLNNKTNKNTWSNEIWRVWLKNKVFLNDGKDFDKAISDFNQRFNTIENQLYVVSLLEKTKKYQKILDFIDKQNKISIELQYAKAFALLSIGQNKEAEFLISHFESNSPLPAINWLKGRLALLNNDEESATILFKQHFTHQPTLPGLIVLIKTALQKNDIQEIISLGEYYLNEYPNDHQARALLSNWLLKRNKLAAIAFMDVPQSQIFITQNWEIANNLAWLYLNINNPKRALLFSTSAYHDKPSDSNVAFTHAMALLQNQNNMTALAVLNDIPLQSDTIKALILSIRNESTK